MTKAEDAIVLAKQGFGCSQIVFSAFAPDLGIDRDTALRLSQGFVGGMSQTDNICGALSGGIMVIGLRYASPRADDIEAKGKTVAAVNEFLQEFKKLHGSINCTDLLGYNLSDLQERAEGKKNIPMRCPPLVLDAVKLVEKLV
ncbi:MAG: C-GCAxxG-C-C family protein [Halobacteriota archaeon]|jgi:C_GCAxxG_C_C family probable redox protein